MARPESFELTSGYARARWAVWTAYLALFPLIGALAHWAIGLAALAVVLPLGALFVVRGVLPRRWLWFEPGRIRVPATLGRKGLLVAPEEILRVEETSTFEVGLVLRGLRTVVVPGSASLWAPRRQALKSALLDAARRARQIPPEHWDADNVAVDDVVIGRMRHDHLEVDIGTPVPRTWWLGVFVLALVTGLALGPCLGATVGLAGFVLVSIVRPRRPNRLTIGPRTVRLQGRWSVPTAEIRRISRGYAGTVLTLFDGSRRRVVFQSDDHTLGPRLRHALERALIRARIEPRVDPPPQLVALTQR